MAQRRIVIVTLQPVGPRTAKLSDQFFGIHLSAAIDPPPGDGIDRRQVLPWTWFAATAPAITIVARDAAGNVAVFDAAIDNTPARPRIRVDDGRGPDRIKALQGLIVNLAEYDCAFRTQPDPSSANAPPRIQDQLAYLGTLVGEIPQALKLVWYFKIGARRSGNIDADKITAFIAAPAIRDAIDTVETAWWSPGAVGAFDVDKPYAWEYERNPAVSDAAPASTLTPSVRVQPLTVGGGAMLRFDREAHGAATRAAGERPLGLDFASYWIGVQASQPWADDLPFLGRRLTDVVRWLGAFHDWAVQNKKELVHTIERVAQIAPSVFTDFKTPEDTIKAIAEPLQTDAATLRAALDSLQSKLTLEPDLIKNDNWSQVLAAALRVSHATPALLASADREVSDRILLAYWDVALRLRDLDLVEHGKKDRIFSLWKGLSDSQKMSWLVDGPNGPRARHRDVYLGFTKQLIKDEIGTRTPRQTAIDDTVAWLSANGPWQNVESLQQLLAEAPFRLPDDPWPTVAAAWSAFVADWSKRTDVMSELPTTESELLKDDDRQEHERGFTLQLDAPYDDVTPNDPMTAPDPDPWRKMAGVGLLVMAENEAKWRFANAGMFTLGKDAKLLDGPALVPMRITVRNGSRTPFLTYNQRWLTAKSPLVDGIADVFKTEDLTDKADRKRFASASHDPHAPKYGYSAVLDAAQDSMRLPPLRYGVKHRVAVFTMDTLKGLPSALTQRADGTGLPWVTRDDLATAVSVPVEHSIEIDYRRRVAVGHSRIALRQANGDVIDWPAIPDDVAPLALEAEPTSDAPGATTHRLGPVLLLPDKPVRLSIKPPTVDIDVYERSLAGDAAGKQAMLAARTEQLLKLRRSAKAAVASAQRRAAPRDEISPPDEMTVVFDDPAVVGIALTLEQWTPELDKPWTRIGDWRYFQFPDGRPHRDWIDIDCAIGDWHLEPTANGFSLLIPNEPVSQVARVFVHVVVDDRAKKFPENFFEGQTVSDAAMPAALAQLKVLQPIHVLLETPTDAMPTAEDVWRALTVETAEQDATLAARQVAVSIDPSRAKAPELFRHVARAQIVKQPWRWQGRHLDPFPLQWPATPKLLPDDQEELLKWERKAFATLDDGLDSLAVPLGYPHVPGGPSQRLTDSFDDKRAQYVRYAANVTSRYAGLLFVADVTSQQPDSGAGAHATFRRIGWRRAFLPYVGGRPPRPVVRAYVPVTLPYADAADASQTDPQIDAVPPLMLVLDEPMFDACGISESLEAQVTISATPPPGGAPLPEYGRDPILDVDHPVDAGFDTAIRPVGPFGFTFDVAARQPLFVASSYLLRPPPKASAWDLAKVRVRRVAVGPTGGAPAALAAEDEWTKGQWVQFLPPSTFGAHWSLVRIVGDGIDRFKIVLAGAPAVQSPRPDRFVYRVLVTQSVMDFRGDEGHEMYRSVVEAKPEADGFGFDLKVNAGDRPYLVRLLEVQLDGSSPATSVGNDGVFWKQLFPDKPGVDASNRITRISPPLIVPR